MTVANLERIYPIKVYKKCRNVGEHLVIGPFSLIFIEIVLGILGVRLIYQCISFHLLFQYSFAFFIYGISTAFH